MRFPALLFALFLFLGACQKGEEAQTESSAASSGEDRLVIVSPHRKSIQEEFIPRFQEDYKKRTGRSVRVDWLDQGGTSAGLRFIRARYAQKPESADVDLFWGGGATAFIELDNESLLEAYELPSELATQIPKKAGGAVISSPENTWHGSAISGFGIFYNKKALKFKNLETPKTWEDLAHPRFRSQLSLTDPRQSGSASTMNVIVLESQGWEEGWRILTSIAANANHFTHSSSDPIKAIVTGDAVAAMAIDFYAAAQIAEVGADSLGFVLPEGETILDPDPIGILKGAPNREVAEAFINFILQPSEQALLMLPQGVEGGPRRSTLGRMGVNKKAYEMTEGRRVIEWNPLLEESGLEIDMQTAGRLQRVINDLVGAILVDTHSELKTFWAKIVEEYGNDIPKEVLMAFSRPPLTRQELIELAEKWEDDRVRNETINRWVEFARQKYRQSDIRNLNQN